MKSIILILIAACLAFTGCAYNRQSTSSLPPSLTSINIVDRNGLTETVNNPERLEKYAKVNFLTPQPYQKVLRIYSRDSHGNIPACITSYHSNGFPHKYLEVINSRACGNYREWHSNGNQRLEVYVMEGNGDIVEGAEQSWVFDGIAKAWNEDGLLEASIPYTKGELDGIATYYHSNGNVWKKIPYNHNSVHGIADIYLCDGSILQTSRYQNGVMEGESKRYWGPEKLAAEEVYSEGLLAHGRYYDCNGQCVAQVDNGHGIKGICGKDCIVELHEYRYGVLDGEVRVLDKYGRVINLFHAKNGNKHGEEICYYEGVKLQQTLQPKLSLNWFEGKVQGVAKTWYDNGVQESQKEMSNNKKNGHSIAWYRDGSLMMIEEYEQDKLSKGEYYAKGEKYPLSIIDEGKGTATLFDADGNFLRKIEYKNGKPLLEE